MASKPSIARGAGLLVLLALPGVATAQSAGGSGELGIGTRIVVRFVVALVVNGLLGGALVALGPQYARDRVADIREDPGEAVLWGLAVGIGVPVVLVILAVTVIGLVVAIPGILVLALVSIVGSAVTVVWVGSLLAGGDEAGAKAVALGAVALSIPAAIPVLGNLVVSLVSLVGLGAVSASLYRSRSSPGRAESPATSRRR